MKDPATLTIGALASDAGVNVETIRFYERKGLLNQPARHSSGYRQYPSEDSNRIRFIKRAQDLGFTLKEIAELLELNTDPGATCGDMRGQTERKLDEVEAKIKDLMRMKKSLKRLVDACGENKKAAQSCRILDCFERGWKC
jgi:MerR family mercuric resistance operon transcriptional regulator